MNTKDVVLLIQSKNRQAKRDYKKGVITLETLQYNYKNNAHILTMILFILEDENG